MIADVAPDPNSGAAGTELALARELEGLGHDVVTVWGQELRHRVRHWNLHHLIEQPIEYRRRIREILAATEIDVLHVNQPAGWLAARYLRRTGWNGLFVHRSHGFEARMAEVLRTWQRVFPEPRRSVARRWASAALRPAQSWTWREIVRRADAHVVSCADCSSYLVRRGARREQILVLPQAPPGSFLEAPVQIMSADRLRRVLCVGQGTFIKGPMVAAEALRLALERDGLLEATWVCEESAHRSIGEMIGPIGAKRLRLLGWRTQRELRDVYDQHGIFVFASFAEGFGKAFLEAMARGLCVVSTQQGGAKDLIDHGVNGVLTPVGDSVAIADAVAELAGDLPRAVGMSTAARRLALGSSWLIAARTLAEFYGSRLEAKRRSGSLKS